MGVAPEFDSSYCPHCAEVMLKSGGDATHAPRDTGTSAFQWVVEQEICSCQDLCLHVHTMCPIFTHCKSMLIH